MSALRIVNIVVFLMGVLGAFYYTATNQEAQGAVVVLLCILYFVAIPQLTKSS